MAKIPYFICGISVRTTENPEYNSGDEMYITYIPMSKAVRFFNSKQEAKADGIGLGIKPIKSDEIVPEIPYLELMNNVIPYITQPTHSTDQDKLADKYNVRFCAAEKKDITNSNLKFNYQPGKTIYGTTVDEDGATWASFDINPRNPQDDSNVRDFGVPYKDKSGRTQMMHIRFSLGCLYAEKNSENSEPIFDRNQFKKFKNDTEIKNQDTLTNLTFDYLNKKRVGEISKAEAKNLYLSIAKSYLSNDLSEVNSLYSKESEFNQEEFYMLLKEWEKNDNRHGRLLASKLTSLEDKGYLSAKDSQDLIAQLYQEYTNINLKKYDCRLDFNDVINKYFYNIIVKYDKDTAKRYYDEYKSETLANE